MKSNRIINLLLWVIQTTESPKWWYFYLKFFSELHRIIMLLSQKAIS
jgi:hypothetical protein